MEDCVTEDKSLLHPVNISPRGESKEDVEESDESRGGERASGFINHLISNLVSGGEGDEEKEEEEHKKEIVNEAKDDEEKGSGGFFVHFISNLVSPLSPKAIEIEGNKVEVFEDKDGGLRSEENVGSSEVGGGIINNIISNLFHRSEDEVIRENEEAETVKIVEGNEEIKTEDEATGGGGGPIGNTVSHLPTSLPDHAAPTTEEACILIHSIIHD